MAVAAAYLADLIRTYKNYQALGEKAIAQVRDDKALHTEIDPQSNSIAIMVKHVAGNLRSRFTDFLTTDGEKPDRNRDGEFEMPTPVSRAEILQWWADGFRTVLSALESMTPADLERTVHIRGEAFLALEALNRSVTHTSYHTGQIVYVARHLASSEWQALTIPKGKSQSAPGDFKTKGLARS
jgi:uncharacterized damage-inducible protein DinB